MTRTIVRSIALMALAAGLVAGCSAAPQRRHHTGANTGRTPAATATPAPPDPTGTPLPTPTPPRPWGRWTRRT